MSQDYMIKYNEAAMAFQRGEHRLSANLYKEAWGLVPTKWSHYRYHILHGVVSILKERYFTAAQEDFLFLEKVLKNKKEPCLYRVQAAKSLGLLHWDQGRREEAAEYYRDAIALGKKATEKERRKKTCTNVAEGTAVRVEDRLVGDVMDEVVEQASENLAALETTSLNRGTPPSPTDECAPTDPACRARRNAPFLVTFCRLKRWAECWPSEAQSATVVARHVKNCESPIWNAARAAKKRTTAPKPVRKSNGEQDTSRHVENRDKLKQVILCDCMG